MLWLGWPGIDPPDSESQQAIENRLRDEFDCLPIFLPKRTFDAYYQGFSNGCLWPLFHYFPQHTHYDETEWQAYLEINGRFRDRLLEVLRPGDQVWIHDYHLMVLPEMVRLEKPEAAIAYFLHIPFPSFEILRYLPWREEIVRGLLGADLIGFHTFGYARHYLSSLLRLTGLENDFGRVSLPGRTVKVDAFPLGIDVARFAAAGDGAGRPRRIGRPEAQAGRPEGDPVGRSARLHQGNPGTSAGLRAVPGDEPHLARSGDPDLPVRSLPHPRPGLRYAQARDRRVDRTHQRAVRAAGLDSDSVPVPPAYVRTPGAALPAGRCSTGHASARRHEPGGQGVPGGPRATAAAC